LRALAKAIGWPFGVEIRSHVIPAGGIPEKTVGTIVQECGCPNDARCTAPTRKTTQMIELIDAKREAGERLAVFLSCLRRTLPGSVPTLWI